MIYNLLSKKIPKEKIFLNESMKKYTSFKIGGPAEILIKPSSIQEMQYILEIVKENNVKLTVIGNGTNLLVNDNGISGIVLKPNFKYINIDNETITCGASENVSKIASIALSEELEGLEFSFGIPGTIGGAIRMNAGAYGGVFSDVIHSTKYIDEKGNIKIINNKQHEFAYRNSIFSRINVIILETTLTLKKSERNLIRQKMIENITNRKTKQPLNYPSAGSVFKRNNEYIIAKLIDECGLKGYSIGGAKVSEKHAGFIINTGNATASDVLKLTEHIKKCVYDKLNVNIELEIICI